MRIFRFLKWLPILVLFLTTSKLMWAQALSPGNLEERISELEKEVATLKKLRELEQQTETATISAGKDGFALKSPGNDFQLRLKGYVQADSRYFMDDTSPATDTFIARRIRPVFEGNVYKHFDFRIMPDFGNGSTSIQDAYIDFKYWKKASLRAGKFKSPFGLERLQSATNISFIERALPTNLVPNRDLGLELHGEVFNGTTAYSLGVLNGVADGGSADQDIRDDKDILGRIFMQPFKHQFNRWTKGIGFGIASSFGKSHGKSSSQQLGTYRTSGQATFFNYRSDTIADGNRFRISPQVSYYAGRTGLLSEYVFSNQNLKRGTSETAAHNQAWQVTASYVLTGEDASYKGVIPNENFDFSANTFGALELVSRVHSLSIDDQVFPVFADSSTSAEKTFAWGLGVNWYLNKNVKLSLDFDQTYFTGGAVHGNRETENVFLSRLQTSF